MWGGLSGAKPMRTMALNLRRGRGASRLSSPYARYHVEGRSGAIEEAPKVSLEGFSYPSI
jgi:hypothetical protein